MFKKIESIIFPSEAENDNQKNDVAILFDAQKYKNTLITNDGESKSQPRGILSCTDMLKGIGIRVMRANLVVLCQAYILDRRHNYHHGH